MVDHVGVRNTGKNIKGNAPPMMVLVECQKIEGKEHN